MAWHEHKNVVMSEYAKQMNNYSAVVEKVNKHNKGLRDRFSELQQDEEWKAQNCRCCPHCGRAVERVQGCSSMKCGQDYHGGNAQNGCGQDFNWDEAAKYEPKAEKFGKEKNVTAAKPELRDGFKSTPTDEYYLCDFCTSEIKGLRFSCIHCPFFDLCEECEQFYPNFHNPNHVFKIFN